MKLKPLLEKFPRRDGNWERNAQLSKDGEVEVELDVEKVANILKDTSLTEHSNFYYTKLAQVLNDHVGEMLVRKR